MANDYSKLFVSDAASDARIAADIEKYRKGDFTLALPAGAAGPVRVRLKNHKFRFGGNLFMLDEIPDAPEKNGLYKDAFKNIFNMATLPFYWDATEPEEGHTRYHKDAEKLYRRPPIDLGIEFCEENNIEPREHALCYERFFPQWLKDKSWEEIKPFLERRMQEISSRYADKIPTIEVTNELEWKYDGAITPAYAAKGFADDCYEMANRYFPNNELAINEWSALWEYPGTEHDWYSLQLEHLLNKGARIDAVGLQYHMFFPKEEYFKATRPYYTASQLYNIMDYYAGFGKPLQITEVTVPAFSNDDEDEAEQADLLEKLYSIWFSHPAMEQIVYWNLADGYAAFTTPGDMKGGENYYYGGLLRFDMTEKPAYKRLKKLIHETWTTDEELTAENGSVSFRGFYGEYEVTCGASTYTVTLNEDGSYTL